MRKALYAILSILFLFSCRPGKQEVERIYEEGVEVVINHLEPYKIRNGPTDFHLHEEFFIDFGSEEIGELGIADAMDFEVDSKGCIYFTYSHKQDDMIFKFSPRGQFIKSWGKKGQGPGEMQFIISTYMTPENNLIISDHSNRRIQWFSNEGELLKEIAYPIRESYFIIYLTGDKRFVGYSREFNSPDQEYFDFVFTLLDENFEVIKKLDVHKYPSPLLIGSRGINYNEFFKVVRAGDSIYVGNEDRGYEIQKFDLQGNLLQEIRKEYTPVEVPKELLKKRKDYYSKSGDKYFFPEHYLPICDFFLDDSQRLYIMTFEKGEISGEHWYDIFNPEGIFINRKKLEIYTWGEIAVCAQVKRDRLYCFQEKEDGYRVFKVYKMIWE